VPVPVPVCYIMLNYSWSSSIDTTLCLAAMCQPAPLAAVTTDDLYDSESALCDQST
jgi:hypothetical protein